LGVPAPELHPKSWTKKQKGVQFIYEISI
jgi:hypothetical protein